MKPVRDICVLGAGSWGTTLAILLSENGFAIRLWEFFPEHVDAMLRDRENRKFLPGIPIPRGIEIGSDMDRAVRGADLLVFVVPSHVVRSVARNVAERGGFAAEAIFVNAAKGLEEGSLKRMSQVLQDELPGSESRIFSLIGPSHAEEVSRRMPTSVVVAGERGEAIKEVQRVFFRPYFRVYTNDDIVGAEIAVALKNIIAIAAGVCDGLGYGDNTKAALLTRGLVEISRLGCALGAKRETFAGLAGIGDLIVTCCSKHSRNRYVGERIGKGETLEHVLAGMVMVAEGVRTTRAAVELGKEKGIELPIIESTYNILFNGKDPREAITELMNRPPTEEMRWAASHTQIDTARG
ncbi:MAG: NAD(P)H-dependent glycerol-3-phosphate dehydrogenase [Chitinivibrionia bacterium]|nr:NAD(P)H-dependent glycerol-3-phosphate dehydrogenase [Chitinivibrionia bacterium]